MTISAPLLLSRIASEFREMPGLCLTTAQVDRLCGLSAGTAEPLLRRLAEDGVLRATQRGYVLAEPLH